MDETPNAPAVANSDSLWLVLPAEEIKRRGKAFSEYLGAIRDFVKSTLTEGLDADYGEIPGTKKPTLLQPGADKLMGLFGLTVRYEVEQREGPEQGRFDVVAVARLFRGEQCMGESTARASSYESKWRYRFGTRKCPTCSAEAIRKSKEEWGGGWYCNKRDGGCSSKFDAKDERILSQEVGKIQNVDIADVFNTILMVAQKRAKVAVVRTVLRLTDMFTQDVGDPENPKGEDGADTPPQKNSDTRPAAPNGGSKAPTGFVAALEKVTPGMTGAARKAMVNEVGRDLYGDKDWINAWADYPRTKDGPLTQKQQDGLLTEVEDRTKAAK